MTTKTRVATAAAGFRNRIVGSGEEAPDRLLANPANWRVHPENQKKALAGALSEIGWVQQVIVNKRTGYVVDGHARVALALDRGESLVPVVYVDLAPEEEALVLATLDPLSAMAKTDETKLVELIGPLRVDDAALARLLRSLGGGTQGLTDPDEVPDPPALPYVQPGDLWVLGEHRLLCGDATNADDVARLLDGGRPTLLDTDPPYGVELDGTWRDTAGHNLGGSGRFASAEPGYMRRKLTGAGNGAGRTKGHTNVTVSGDTRADWSAAFELVPSLEVAYVWHASSNDQPVRLGLERVGFDVRQQIIWVKNIPVMTRQAYHWQHEPCYYAVRKGSTAHWIGDRKQTTVWEATSPKMIMGGSTEEKFDHPTQKPVELMARPIRNHDGDVYEPFSGSGTTLIAAEMLGRRCFAMEIDPKFVQLAVERWQAFTGRQAERITIASPP